MIAVQLLLLLLLLLAPISISLTLLAVVVAVAEAGGVENLMLLTIVENTSFAPCFSALVWWAALHASGTR